jgi:hypothetical protein
MKSIRYYGNLSRCLNDLIIFINGLNIIKYNAKRRPWGKHIVVSDTNYEILNSLGSITSSFDSVISDLLKKANVNGKSMAGAALNSKEKEDK